MWSSILPIFPFTQKWVLFFNKYYWFKNKNYFTYWKVIIFLEVKMGKRISRNKKLKYQTVEQLEKEQKYIPFQNIIDQQYIR